MRHVETAPLIMGLLINQFSLLETLTDGKTKVCG